MKSFLTPLAQSLTPYTPGEQPKDRIYVKLNTNENPYPPSPKVFSAMQEAMDGLRLYPDPESTSLCDGIVEALHRNGHAGIGREHLFVGNGSDEVLAFAFPAFFTGKRVVFPNITYSFYPVYAQLFQTDVTLIPLDAAFQIKVEDYCNLEDGAAPGANAAGSDQIAGILIANPNAPTGCCLTLEEIRRILVANPDRLVLIDEAYVDFGGESAASMVLEFDNLLVVQTLSKSRSLAGLRAGFAIGHPALIDGLNRIKNSFNSYPMDRLAQAGARAAMLDQEYFDETCTMVIRTRERVAARLKELGFSVLPSKANFLFISHGEKPAAGLFAGLREKGVLVRYFAKPLIDNHLRVSIGTDQEMDVFLGALEELLSK